MLLCSDRVSAEASNVSHSIVDDSGARGVDGLQLAPSP